MSADTSAPIRAPEPPAPPPVPLRATTRLGASLRRAAPALGLYAASRLIGLVCMAVWAGWVGKHPRTLLGYSWDSVWYVGIVRHGYNSTLPPDPAKHGVPFSDMAFFPLFPMLMRTLTTVLPITAVTAGLVVAWVSAGVAAWGIYAVGERLHGRRVGTALVVLWGLLPHAIVQAMAYTEPLLTALAAWSLYAVLTRRWVWAGTLALLAGASRPNGIAVAAAVCCCAAAEVLGRRASWRVWGGAALSPLGWLGYLAWVGYRRGSWHGYFAVQDEWGSRFDFGVNALRFVRSLLISKAAFAYFVALVILGVALLLFALLTADRPPLSLLIYTLVLVAITLGGSGYFASKPRFLLPAFPLLLPVAMAMARARPRTAVLLGGALAGLSFVYGTYLLTVARIPI
ncbi:hypothetical protein SBI_05668 [Streptomyces bingchenggensis BCW-1]|uniref:Integral membrane protein n=1 Tax=Streptomyces bingchenggensis (strain BCW-1) TaxID=749414 RepID=D7CCQ7_STRBB|nr:MULTISPECIES: membrane protein [Streptomyces]ADI08788.1 hypothetical protein SBI_05668 [Streptomyces bingchenggensis BCW-1]